MLRSERQRATIQAHYLKLQLRQYLTFFCTRKASKTELYFGTSNAGKLSTCSRFLSSISKP
jgi:hypothetical protein